MLSQKSEKIAIPLRPMSEVYIGTGNGLIKKALKKGLDALGGLSKFIKPGQSVFIKPNLTDGRDPITGGVTDKRLVETLLQMIREECQPGHVMVGENTGDGGVIGRYFAANSWDIMCEKYAAELVDFEKDEWGDYPLENPMYLDVIRLPKKVVEADVYITLPVLKNHDTVCVTAAIKNSYGLLPAVDRRETHRYNAVEQCLTDIARVRKPDLAIVDGRIGMEGIAGGSHFDHPRYANRIIIGADPVAVDVVCTHIMDQNPRVRYLQWCDYYGVGNCNLDYITVKGMSIEEAKMHFMTPAEETEEVTDGKLKLRDLDSCSRCRAAAQGPLHRIHGPERLMNDVEILYGPGDFDPSTVRERCILVGDCIQEKYRNLGLWIPGCPMEEKAYFEALEKLEVICNKCEKAVRAFIAKHTEEELAFIRIMASNKRIFQGSANKAEATDYTLLVGDCMFWYGRHHKKRSQNEIQTRGLDVDVNDIVVHMPGHDLSVEDIEAVFQKMRTHYLAHRPATEE